jgi:peroxiredoxin
LAEFREHYDEFRAANTDVAAISVDDAVHSEPVRNLYQLPFPILCDSDAAVVKSWGLFDPIEKGGISRSAVFVIEPGLRVACRSLDSTMTRIRAAELAEFVRARQAGREAPVPARHRIIPTAGELLRTAIPSLKEALFPRRK